MKPQLREFLVSTKRFAQAAKLDLDLGELHSAYVLFYKAGDQNSLIEALRTAVELLSQTLPLGKLRKETFLLYN